MSLNVFRFFGSADWLILLVVVALVHALIVIVSASFRAERIAVESERQRVTDRISEGRA